MSNVIKLFKEKEIQHVMFDRDGVEGYHRCDICGDLEIIDGHVWHTKPMEDHGEVAPYCEL